MRYRDFKYIALTESRMEDYHFTSKNKKYVQQRSEMGAFVKSGKLKVQRPKDPKEGAILSIKNPTLVFKQLQNITKQLQAGKSLRSLKVDLGDGTQIQANHLHKNQTDLMIVDNVGTVLEGLTGIAVATLLAKQGDVTKDNMKMIATELLKSEGAAILTERGLRKDKIKYAFSGSRASDRFILDDLIAYGFDITDKKVQNKLNQKYQFSKDAIQKLINQCDIVVKYANTGRTPYTVLRKFEQREFEDKVVQTLTVMSDGGDSKKQSVTKVDLEIQTEDPQKGTTREKLTSIKSGSGSHQGGQVSGKTYRVLNRFWVSSLYFKLPPVFKKGFDQKTNRDILNKGIKPTYHFAQQQAKKMLAQDVESNERQFLRNMQLGLKYHLQMDDPDKQAGSDNVTVFIANPEGSKQEFNELQFNDQNFLETLKFFDLEVSDVNENANDVNFQITAKLSPKVKDIKQIPSYVQSMMKKGKVPGKYLAMYRSKIESGGSLRNTVWIGQQAEVLANVNNAVANIDTAKPMAQPTPAPAPTPTPPPPQNKPPVQPTPAV